MGTTRCSGGSSISNLHVIRFELANNEKVDERKKDDLKYEVRELERKLRIQDDKIRFLERKIDSLMNILDLKKLKNRQ